jgi:hypothetical protein
MDFFLKTCLPLGDPKRSKVIFIGTVLHFNSCLNQVLNNFADWKALKYSALEAMPTRLDLWTEWENLYHDRSEGSNPMEASRLARDKAMKFLQDHWQEMHEGAKVLWKERMDLVTLMERRAQDRNSFNTEYANNPIDEASRVFHKIHYYDPKTLDEENLEYFMAVDPSMGKSKRSDPSVILTAARDVRSGIVYIVDVDEKRRHPDQIIEDVIRKAEIYPYSLISVETTAFQQMLKDELSKRASQRGIYLPLREFKSTVKRKFVLPLWNHFSPMVIFGFCRLKKS